MCYMKKWPSRMQGQFYFSKSGRVGKEHGLHPGSEGGVAGARPTIDKCGLANVKFPTLEMELHPNLRNNNLHSVTQSLISSNLRERMLVVQISLLVITLLSLISSWILLLMQTTKEVNPHPCIASCVNMWSVIFLFLFFSFCHLLNVGACICHITMEDQVEWTTCTTP